MAAWLTRTPSAPLITYYGPGATRIELSGATAANAVSKAANLFADELLAEPGDVVWFRLPCHWQAPVLALGAWAAGLTIALGETAPDPAIATVASEFDAPPAGTGLAVSLHPWGLPLGRGTPAGWEDLAGLARSQPDSASWQWPGEAERWLLTDCGRDGASLARDSRRLAGEWALPEGGRLLVTAAPTGLAAFLACTLVPALARGSLILADGADVEEVTRQEGNAARAPDV